MNNLRPYEKHLADKLRQVPIPDKEQGWQQMKKLLDRDGREGGAGWAGNRKWWWMGITVGIIMTGVWLSQYFSEQTGNQVASAQENTSTSSKTESDKINSTKTSEKSAAEVKSATIESNEKEISAIPLSKDNAESKDVGNAEKNKSTLSGDQLDQKSSEIAPTSISRSLSKKGELEKGEGNNLDKSNVQKNSGIRNAGNKLKDDEQVSQKQTNNSTRSGVLIPNTKVTEADNNSIKADIAGESENSESELDLAVISKLSNLEPGYKNPMEDFTSVSEEDGLKIIAGKTDRAFLKEMRQKSIEKDGRKISGRRMRGNMGEKDRELTFAAGLALPQSVAVGSQQSPAYGVNAKSGRLGDYLPVPFFQYHLNSKLFLQTELHFQSPQFTNRLLMSYSMTAQTNVQEKSVYLEKLYYFNIPFNLYFSPAKNLYIGSGLQYSSLLSGVASFNERTSTGGTTISSISKVQRFKDDSLASKLSPSEWRYQFDASYYLKRFTIGLRYNEAMKDFVNLRVATPLPATQARNKSFLLYLRFNIWEERKKSSYYTAGNW